MMFVDEMMDRMMEAYQAGEQQIASSYAQRIMEEMMSGSQPPIGYTRSEAYSVAQSVDRGWA